ncbi:uncharacterized protein PgNI_04023 [Pyricularia grisea]|uniref:Uncharacterized protein n=1 Tax=Pyricularia grisea TaxID=148305 RepID=A0A6P8BBG4_PYRGI|nr:uncharacterized protein PgNI_04023 [Pyricularia grisea]TLD13170.1 hypothetical protein PgNI_04023 [Pyricularia grisea]
MHSAGGNTEQFRINHCDCRPFFLSVVSPVKVKSGLVIGWLHRLMSWQPSAADACLALEYWNRNGNTSPGPLTPLVLTSNNGSDFRQLSNVSQHKMDATQRSHAHIPLGTLDC